MTKQVNGNLSTYLKAGLVFGANLAAARQVPQAAAETSDSLALQHTARSLQQIGFATPAKSPPPPKSAPPPPKAPSPPPPAPSGYYDILATKTPCAAVVPDWNHYGACSDASVAPTLARVTALAQQGCNAFVLDLFETDLLGTAAYNDTTMGYIQDVANHAANLGMVMLVGPSKDDVTMDNRVPTGATSDLVVALANQFQNNFNVGINVGGLPANNGTDTASIAQTYGDISTAARATGYKGLLTFTAPEQDGRTGLNYFVPTANRIQDPNMRFVVYPYSGGNTTETLSWMQPCVKTLPCTVITGLQTNATDSIFNNITAVNSELSFTNSNKISSFVTPWDSAAVLSDQGEQVMLTGNACAAPNATVGISPAGTQLINLQKNVTVG